MYVAIMASLHGQTTGRGFHIIIVLSPVFNKICLGMVKTKNAYKVRGILKNDLFLMIMNNVIDKNRMKLLGSLIPMNTVV